MEDTTVHALDYVSVFRRRKRWLFGPMAISVVVGAALVRFLPKEYKSSTTLGVAAPIVSPTLVSQTTQFDNQERLRALSLQLLSVPILSRVAKEEGLGTGGAGDPQLARLRKAIEVTVPDPVATTNEPRRLDTFVVAYSDADPSLAQRITNRLANVFVDANSKARAERAEDTSAFIATELRASQARLSDLEGRLRRAKEAYMGRLPEQTAANLQTLSGVRQQLEANAMALRSEQDRLSMVEHQIDAMKQGSAEALLLHAGGSSQPPETRVMMLERELQDARATYTDKHPEVQRLQEELESAKREAAKDRQRPTNERLASLQVDPAYRQLLADRDNARLRVRELERASADAQRQIGMYQNRVEEAPMVEQQLASLTRDYELEKAQYSELSGKLHTATIAENVERNRGGEQFTVLYPASLPTEPSKPQPLRVFLMAIVGGVILGCALMLGREYFDRSIHDMRDLKNEVDLPVLGEVGRIEIA